VKTSNKEKIVRHAWCREPVRTCSFNELRDVTEMMWKRSAVRIQFLVHLSQLRATTADLQLVQLERYGQRSGFIAKFGEVGLVR